MNAPMKPRPSLAALQWIEKHTGAAEAAVNDYQSFEADNCLGARLGHAVWMTEAVTMNLARNAIGRRKCMRRRESRPQERRRSAAAGGVKGCQW
jgi:hypothetical protein